MYHSTLTDRELSQAASAGVGLSTTAAKTTDGKSLPVKTTQDAVGVIMALMSVANTYRVDVLRKVCVNYLRHRLAARSALALYAISPELAQKTVEDNISALIHSSEWLEVPAEKMAMLLQSDDLAIGEPELFRGLVRWIPRELGRRDAKDTVAARRAAVADILPHVRFPIMTLEQLSTDVRPTGLLPDDHLVQLFTWMGKRASATTAAARSAAQTDFKSQYPTFPYAFGERRRAR